MAKSMSVKVAQKSGQKSKSFEYFEPKPKTMSVIVSNDDNVYQSTGTSNLWVGVSPFSRPSEGNKVKAFTTGKAYFADLISEITAAKESIYITGWQVNWDAQLDSSGKRLFDVLLNAVILNSALKIYIMPWDDSAPIQTYDDQTKAVLELINNHERVKRECVFVNLAKSMADADASFFSHHQKHVVIDNKIGYVGGIDLAYGRFDDENYDLHADAENRKALNRYNSCINQVGKLNKNDIVDPDLLTGLYDRLFGNRANTIAAIMRMKNKVHQAPYEEDNPISPMVPAAVNSTLDEKMQPRMPWQDNHLRIDGPAVADLALNFVLRWNTERGYPKKDSENNIKLDDKGRPVYDVPTLDVPNSSIHLPDGSGSCSVQVLRSAPRNMCHAEFPLMSEEDQLGVHQPIEAQANVADAMKNMILTAQHFIYIENQFFVSGFGVPDAPETLSGVAAEINKDFMKVTLRATASRIMPGDSHETPQNIICALLAQRLYEVIMGKPEGYPFHIYITLPVHPEGGLNEGAIATQVHWTMQSLVFGSQSLLSRLRRILMAKRLGITDRNDKVYHDDDKQYLSILPEEYNKYVTLLNLRNWAKLDNGNYVTEQIYIHSKMMIVDDRYALLGSANINDRSLLGSRDSEIAVLVSDNKTEDVDLCGDGNQQTVRSFARQLRMDVWRKIFGITAGGKRAATKLENAVLHPAATASWQAIRDIAQKNTQMYEDAFNFIPRNKNTFGLKDKKTGEPLAAPLWPIWNPEFDNGLDEKGDKIPDGKQMFSMPFDEKFWSETRFDKAAAEKLDDVKGFITLLPIEWTATENNNLGYHTRVVAMLDPAEKDKVALTEVNPKTSTSTG